MALRTGLIVEVPEAETLVGPHRLRMDPNASLGVPAHVTVLYPMGAPSEVDAAMLARLETVCAAVAPFEHRLVRTAWFGSDVLWLASDADAEFRALTALAAEAFPEYPPYGGQFDDVVPHLTVGDRAPLRELQAAESALRPELPIRSVARAATLMVQQPSRQWVRAHAFRFSG
jgi:hypothetical protein